MPPKPDLIIFDIGNVLLPLSPAASCRYWKEQCGIEVDETEYILSYFTPEARAFETGRIPADTFSAFAASKLGLPDDHRLFCDGFNRMLDGEYPGISGILSGLKKKYQMTVLSNTNELHAPWFMQKHPDIFSLFEKLFFSHEIGDRKPANAAFISVLKAMNCAPEKSLFFDDSAENIAAARQLGMQALWVRSHEDLIRYTHKLM